MMDLRPELGFYGLDFGHFAWIQAIMFGFGPFCFDFGYIAWIQAIWKNLGQKRPQRRSPDEEGGMGKCTDG